MTDETTQQGDLVALHRKVDEINERTRESEQDLLEIIATVLLGVAAVAIAWSAYQSSLWGGIQDTALTKSVNTTTESVDLLQQADTLLATDQALFIEIFTSGACTEEGDEFVCDQIFANMSEPGAVAVRDWFDNDELVPFDSPDYRSALFDRGEELAADAEQFFDDAATANQNGDDYELASTILTIVLFFAGISIVLGWQRLRVVLNVVGATFLGSAIVYLFTLPTA